MSLAKATATVGGNTMISRILGFVRDMLIAATLGAGPVAEAFVYAFTFPNLFRRGEGAFNSAFVPLYSKRVEAEGEVAAKRFSGEAVSILLFAMVVLTILVEIFAPYVVMLIAPGFRADPVKFDLTVLFLRIVFPYLVFISLMAVLAGILNAHRRFAAAAAAPTLLNVIVIPVLIFGTNWFETPGHSLIIAIAFAGIAQFLALVWACARVGLVPRLPRPQLTPAMRDLIRLGIPGALAAGIVQINLVIGGMIASFEEGARPMLYYADRLYQLPLGVIGVAMGVVLLPEISRRLAAKDDQGVHDSQNRALELSLFFTLPAAVALFIVPAEMIHVLFEHGAFTPENTSGTAKALMAFAFGLAAFVLIKVFSPGFFAREDTKTPRKCSTVNAVDNVALSLWLFFEIGFVGIAIATTIAGWVNAILLGITLHRRGHYVMDRRLMSRLPRTLIASLAMGTGIYYLNALYFKPLFAGALMEQVLALGALVLGGIVIYGATALLLGAAKLSDIKGAVRR